MKYRVRHVGGGRKRREVEDDSITKKVETVIEDHVAGCPITGVTWTYLHITELQAILERDWEVSVSWHVLNRITKKQGFGKRSLSKQEELKKADPERNAQFKNIARLKEQYLAKGYAVLSIDTKKKELLGRFHRPGQCLSKGERKCFDHDFPSFADGKVVPHGIYDVGRNEGHITLCESKDTAEFNVDACWYYWQRIGRLNYPQGTPILLLADGGGSNACNNRMFKQELQDWADDIQADIRVAHYPAYCSKYNPIEHRLFPTITRCWQGVMLDNIETMKELVTKRSGLSKSTLAVSVSILQKTYQNGVKVLDGFLDKCNIVFDDFLPKRNYQILSMPKLDS